MKVTFVSVLINVAIALTAVTVYAHESHHDEDGKLIPTTCAQLANKKDYVNDVVYPEVKELKTRCETESKKSSKQSPAESTRK